MPPFDQQAFWNIAVAALCGLSVGIERQWSGHALGSRARFAGIRTFTLFGLVAGLSGWLWAADVRGPALVFLAGLGALVVVAYFSASRTDVDGTTEVAAFVVMAAGLLAGAGMRAVASGLVAITALLLVEKKRLHGWVRELDQREIRAGTRFAVMAAVILPLLPEGPFGPYGAVKPRLLWALVLFFSGFSFVGYVIERVAGPGRGYVIAGTLGGLLSSTSVTLTFARLSRNREASATALAAGAIGASVVLLPRLLVTTAVLAPAMTSSLWPRFVIPAVIGAAFVLRGWKADARASVRASNRNPLQFASALQMAALFQAVLFVVAFVTAEFGQRGIYASAAVLGLADMDALTVSMAQLTTSGTPAATTARAVTIGVISNTFVKLGIALAVGHGGFRALAAAGLAAMALALGGSLYWG
jgi:uncharacterized membrane protein (DUF4010 family)